MSAATEYPNEGAQHRPRWGTSATPTPVLDAIAAAVYAAANPPHITSLDPILLGIEGSELDTSPTSLPTTYPLPNWTEAASRLTLINLCLVSKSFYESAKPYVWRRVEIRLPRSWLGLVHEITGGEDIVDEQASELVEQSLSEAASMVWAATSHTKEMDREAVLALRASIRNRLAASRDSSIPPEFLTPPESREASPIRTRRTSKSPGRWRVIRAVSQATRDIAATVKPNVYIPTPQDARPGRHILHLNFNHFRTIGMRRSVDEGVHARFVTGERLELVLKEMPNLVTFGATEYMDGALTFSVLSELLFRARPINQQRQRSRGRSAGPENSLFGPSDWNRRNEAHALEALDFCGCVSSVFVKALADFVAMYLIVGEEEQERGRGRSGAIEEELLHFPHMKRLCLRSISSVPASILSPFVLAFPNLTHLDLSCTRCTPEILDGLAASTTLHLTALSLARCHRLTSESITALLIYGSATYDLEHLSLFGDATCPCPLTEEDLDLLIVQAPCFKQGKLVYLDISSAPLTARHLSKLAPMPRLRSLGLSHISDLELTSIASFLLEKAANVEILTLISTSPQLAPTAPPRQSTMAIHSHIIQHLCTVPFSIFARPDVQHAKTRLRIIELKAHVLSALGGGAGSWRVVRSKGARGWYVDTASGWVSSGDGPSVMRRDLPIGHPLRKGLEQFAESGGNVSTGVGWHSRKMEVLHGHGMLGREDGLYGAMAFAFAG